MITLARVKRGMYVDSITLMSVARSLGKLAGVAEVAALMATPTNLQLLVDAGLVPFQGATSTFDGTDTLIVVRADDTAHAEAALNAAEAHLLAERGTPSSRETRHSRLPRSLEEAARLHPQANVAVIAVPGPYAAMEAQQALRAGLHVFLFSDHVSLADEVLLKRLGSARGLLVMGPDCGTARLNGVGLGFVNVVPDGPVGIVGASGTGMQQVMCLLAESGHGISQAIGCGGRDLSGEVGGATALQGVRMLQEDEATRVIVLISKPAAPEVAETVLQAAACGEKPVVVSFPGSSPALWQHRYAANIYPAHTLTEAAHLAGLLCTNGLPVAASSTYRELDLQVRRAAAEAGATLPGLTGQPPYLAALFSGGTLCDEALRLWDTHAGPIYSNVALNPAWRWPETGIPQGHYALDLGADEYTQGRPHPMIDPEARLTHLRQAASNPLVGVILLDVVLGYCAHPDPAAIYAPVIEQSLQQAHQDGRRLSYILSLCGTEGDPQKLSLQQARLRAAGAEVYTSNARAALRSLDLLTITAGL